MQNTILLSEGKDLKRKYLRVLVDFVIALEKDTTNHKKGRNVFIKRIRSTCYESPLERKGKFYENALKKQGFE